MTVEAMRWALVLSIALTTVLLVGLLATVEPTEIPKYGHRGAERRRALEAEGLFSAFDPVIRFVAGITAQLPLGKLRDAQTRLLLKADDVLGLCSDELSALSILSALLLGPAVWAIGNAVDGPAWWTIVAVALGFALPYMQVKQVIKVRSKVITRSLPPAIEIAAMCMGAGLDFPGAIRMLAERNSPNPTPLGREFAVLLEQLDFGHTRKEALEHFAERVPTRPVIDFVHAVIQAEQKGNPLARVLQVQGRMLSLQRSVLAEEAAARAGVLLILPMVLLVAAILLLLMGPFIVTGIGW